VTYGLSSARFRVPRPIEEAAPSRYRGSVQADPSAEVAYCEVCRLSHRKDAIVCEACSHPLGGAPGWSAVRGRRDSHLRHSLVALAVVVGMLLLNYWMWGGAGYILALGPVAWLVRSIRYPKV
jgi:hypothetical protein